MAEFENVAIDVKAEDIEYVAKRPLITYIGKPTSSTKGLDGQLYFDEAEKKLYLCIGTNASGNSYTWVSINDLSDYVLNSLTIAGIDLKDNITAGELKEALDIDLSKYVETSTKIAGWTLSSDISAEELAKALSVSSIVVETKAPTFNYGEENTFWIDSTTNTLYYCDKRTLSGYNWIEIASGSVTDEQVQKAVDNYLDENPVKVEGGLSAELTNALKTYFTNMQLLLSQLAYTTDEHIGNTLIQNAKDIVSALNSEPITPEEPDEPDVPIEPDVDISQSGSILTILSGVTATQDGTILAIA